MAVVRPPLSSVKEPATAYHKVGALRFVGLGDDRDELFGVLVCVHGVLVRPFAKLVSGQMISFSVGGGSGGMGVSCQVVKFCGSIVF